MELFPVSPEERQNIYNIFNTSEEQVAKNVEIIKEWIHKQPHLPQHLPYDNFIEQWLLNNKFDVEKTKTKIDQHFTLKTINKYFMSILGNDKLLKPSENFVSFYPIPKLGPNMERIMIFHIHNPDLDVFDTDNLLYAILTFVELTLKYNVSNGFFVIMDYAQLEFEHFKKLDLNRYVKILDLITKAYTSQIAQIALINSPSFINVMLAAFQLVIKEEIMNRMIVHNNVESLHKFIQPEYLPDEYGGTLGPLKNLQNVLDKVYEENHEFFKDVSNYKSNEKLRIGQSNLTVTEEIDDNFRNINFD